MTRYFWIYVLTWLPFTATLVVYAVFSPNWRRNRTGRAVMALVGSIVAVLTFALLAQFTDISDEVRDYIRVVMLGGVSLAGWWFLANLIRELRAARRSDCPKRRSTDHS